MKKTSHPLCPGFMPAEVLVVTTVVVCCDGGIGVVSPGEIRDIGQRGSANHLFWRANAH